MEGQVRGIARMIEREEYCVDILQQTAALRAAVDAVSILVLEDHVQGCVRTAAERGEADQYVDEVIDVVRRTLGRPVRGSAVAELGPLAAVPRRRADAPVGWISSIAGRASARRSWHRHDRSLPARLPVAAPAVTPPPPFVERRRRLAPRRRPGSPHEETSLLARALDILAADDRAPRRASPASSTCSLAPSGPAAPPSSPRARRDGSPWPVGPGRGPRRGRALAAWLDAAAPRSRAERAAAPARTDPRRPDEAAWSNRRADPIAAEHVRVPCRSPAVRARHARVRVHAAIRPGDACASASQPTLARHAAVALALVTEQLAHGTRARRAPRRARPSGPSSCPRSPTSCARR